MKNLISNTAFGNHLNKLNIPDYEYRYRRSKFDEFLEQLLQIWMFVPCKLVDGVWVVIEEKQKPLREDYHNDFGGNDELYKCNLSEYKEYQKAKERCLFQGLEYHKMLKLVTKNVTTYSGYRIYNKTADLDEMWDIIFDEDGSPRYKLTIENIAKHNPELTETSIKQLGF